jgi:hypothetical protein
MRAREPKAALASEGRDVTGAECNTVRVLSVTVAALAVACALCCSYAGASAAGWKRAARLTSRASTHDEFVASPDGRRIDLVTLTEGHGFALYPWLPGGALGTPLQVPSSRDAGYTEGGGRQFHGEYPGAAINDAGAFVLAWETRGHEVGLGVNECFCAVRAVVGQADGRLGAVKTLARPSGPTHDLLGSTIEPDGRASVLWQQYNGPGTVLVSGSELWLSQSTRAGRWSAPRQIARETGSQSLESVDGRPQVIYQRFIEGAEAKAFGPEVSVVSAIYAAQPPLASPRLIGFSADGEISNDGSSIVSDGHGDDLIISSEWEREGVVQALYRHAGGRFGSPRTIARFDELDDCPLTATMNKRGEALAAWTCSKLGSESPTDTVQVAWFGRAGKPRYVSRALGAFGAPRIALGARGRWFVVAEAPGGKGLVTLSGYRGHVGARKKLTRKLFRSSSLLGVAVTRDGTALMALSEPGRGEHIGVFYHHL